MAQIFNSFVSGVDAGTQQREQRDRRTALTEAGRLYAANDAQGAENALIGAGLVNEAGAYSALNEARRGRTTREAVSQAMTGLDPNASATDRLNAGATAALGAGDTDQWFAFQQAASQMSAQQREEAGQRAQWIGSAAASLLDVPMEQRVERARALHAASPYANDQSVAQMIDEAGELSDDALNAAAQNSMSAAEILGMRRQESQFNRSLAASERAAYRAANPGDTPLTNSQRISVLNSYGDEQRQIAGNLGIMEANLPYSRTVLAYNGDLRNVMDVNAIRMNDQALLRAAARGQTGPGVLTDVEVVGTLTPSFAQQIRDARSMADIDFSRMTEQDRRVLAEYVMRAASGTQRQLWDHYAGRQAEWGQVGNSPTFDAPRIVHPDDEYRLQQVETRNPVVGQEYTGNGGRVYLYRGPGDWVYSRGGGTVGGVQRSYPIARPRVEQNAIANASNAPPVGTVVGDYRFRGGNPNDRANWERVGLNNIGAGNR